MRIICLIFAALLVLSAAALAESDLPFDPKKGGIEAKGPGKKAADKIKKKLPVKTVPAGPKTAGKVDVPPSKAAVLECNGAFRGTVKVRSYLAGPARNFTVASPARARKNIKSANIRPKKFKLRKNGLRVLDVSGSLLNQCKKGRLPILVTWPGPIKKGRRSSAQTGETFSIAPLLESGFRLPILIRAQFIAKSRLNAFGFYYAVRCCPNINGRYKITIDRSKNVKRIKIRPSSFVCSPGILYAKHTIRISGSLTDHSKLGTIDFKIAREGGASCLGRARISPPKRKR